MKPEDDPFWGQYNTPLSPKQEQAFQKWARQEGREYDQVDYDTRGAWRDLTSGNMAEADNGHLGDKYKKPNHPTFSDQSIYHGVDGHHGGAWTPGANNTMSFTAGETQRKLWSPERLQRYFQEVEPNVQLVIPQPDTLARPKK